MDDDDAIYYTMCKRTNAMLIYSDSIIIRRFIHITPYKYIRLIPRAIIKRLSLTLSQICTSVSSLLEDLIKYSLSSHISELKVCVMDASIARVIGCAV